MCVLNELIDLMVYTPDKDFNSILGEPDYITVFLDSEPASFTTAAPAEIRIAMFVQVLARRVLLACALCRSFACARALRVQCCPCMKMLPLSMKMPWSCMRVYQAARVLL